MYIKMAVAITVHESLDLWCSSYTKLLYQHSNILRDKAGECSLALSNHVSDTDEFRGNMSPQRVMEIVTLSNALEQKACHDTDAKRISAFFTAMNSQLESGSLGARTAIDILIALSTSTGILLPFFRSPGSEQTDVMSSNVSINTITDEMEEGNQRLWIKICNRLSRSLLDQLADMEISDCNTALVDEGCVERLLVLNSSGTAWLSFKQLRTRQLDQLGQLTFRSENDGNSKSWNQLVTMPAQWRQYSATICSMIECDVRLLNLFDVGNALDALINLYLDFVCEEIRNFVEAVDGLISEPPSPAKKASSSLLSARSKRRVSPDTEPTPEERSLDLDQLLLIVDTFSSWCQLEAHLLQVVNDFWSNDTIGVDFEAAIGRPGAATTSQKPKGVLKKLRRNSRRPSSHLLGPGEEKAISLSLAELLNSRNSTESPQVQEGSPAIQPYLEWQTEAELLFPVLARAVEMHMNSLWLKMKLTDDAQTAVNSFGQKTNGMQDSPAFISSPLWDYLHYVERLVPLLAEGCQSEDAGPELQLFAAFSNVLTEHLGSVQETVTAVLLEPSCDLLLLIANLQCLQDFCFRLGLLFMAKDEASGSSFWDWRKRLGERVTEVEEEFVRIWDQRLLTSILQDAESHHWGDTKEFYENERVSFTLQFWRIHLAKMWHRMSECCSAELAKQTMRKLLLRSVKILRQRYLNAKPQPRRLQQFRADILTIMRVAEDFLCRASPGLEEMLGVDNDIFSTTRAIHAEMMGLMHVLVVVASPLSDFHAVHRKGFYRVVASSEISGDERNFSAGLWLGLVDGELYPSCLKARNVRDMLATNAICVQLRLLCAFPTLHPPSLLRILSMCDSALSVLLVSQAPPDEAKELYRALFRIFAFLPTLAPSKLSRLVMASMKGENDLSVFSEFYQPTRTDVPTFFDSLLFLFEPYTVSAASSLLNLLTRPDLDLASWLDRLQLSSSLPCGCRFEVAHAGAMHSAAVSAQLAEVAESMATQLFSLPLNLRHAIASVQARLEDEGVRPAGGHVALHLLLHALMRRLRAEVKARGHPVSKAQTLWATLRQKMHDLPSLKDIVALALSGVTLEDITDFSHMLDGADVDAMRQRQTLMTAVRDASTQPGIFEDINYLYYFLKRNEGWVFANMGFSGSQTDGDGPELQLDIRARETRSQFDVLSVNREFDTDSERATQILDSPGMWAQLVANTRLGVSRSAFVSLMTHRPDFVTDGFLDDHEKRQVAELKDKFHV